LDKALIDEIERAKIRRLDLTNTKFGIIIELRETAGLKDVISLENNNNPVQKLEKVVRDEHSFIIAKLKKFGAAKSMKILPFANSIYAELTFDQIQGISNLKDIRAIRLSKTEHVAC
jgi:hypothetical protein